MIITAEELLTDNHDGEMSAAFGDDTMPLQVARVSRRRIDTKIYEELT